MEKEEISLWSNLGISAEEREPCYINAFGQDVMKFGVSRSLGLTVTAMGYVFPTQDWP